MIHQFSMHVNRVEKCLLDVTSAKRLTLFSPHKWSFICCKNPKFSLETAFTLEN